MRQSKKRKKPLRLGIGHFWIGKRDGVNVVIMRNVESLLELQPDLKVTLFGKLAGTLDCFIKSETGSVEYINIDEFDPGYDVPGMLRKTISEQKIQDYLWHGTNISETLAAKLKSMDIVLAENLGIGINPAVTYAFYLYLQYCQHHHPRKRIFYRAHDFLQQRAKNFENLKKFQDTEIPLIPNWHEVIYPNYPNLGYITINSSDIARLIEHGIDRERIAYVPNSVDEGLIIDDDEHVNLRKRIVEELGVNPEARLILYPVRCIKRKNVEEAIFLTCLFNAISKKRIEVQGTKLTGKFHLLVGIKPETGEELAYAETIESFCRKHKLPATIGLQNLVSFEREIEPRKMEITKFALGDAFNMADIVITTSYLEGFGFAFIEPWYLGKAVIGRNLPHVTQDFQRAGVNLDHLYNVLRIDGQDYYTIGYQDRERIGLDKRLKEVLKLKNPAYLKTVIESNSYNIGAMVSFLLRDGIDSIIGRNRDIVAAAYSPRRVAEQLYEVLSRMPLRSPR